MFNLIVSGSGWEPRRNSFGSGRGLEYTDAAIAHRFMPNKVLDKLHGTGTFHYRDGAKNIGDWREDKREGTGIYTQPSGNKYVGQWQAGKPHGRGTTAFANRTTFVGFYQEGKRNGEGILYAADGSVQGSGLWVNDDLTKSYSLDTSQFPLQRAR